MAKRWRKTELVYLERNAATESIDDLAKRFKTDSESVKNKMSELGLNGVSVPGMDEAAIQRYASAVALLADHNWAKAADAFRNLIATVDSRQLRAMAQQQLDICHRQLEDDNVGQHADPYLRAVFLKNRGQLDEALALCDGAAQDDERIAFLAASVHALQGNEEHAVELLDAAIRLEPKNRVHAFHDPDFESIRKHEGFKALIASR